MRRIILLIGLLACLAGLFFLLNAASGGSGRSKWTPEKADTEKPFLLKKGDILVRPNWSWLPGSSPVSGGRKYGHVAVVTEGAEGSNINEALEKAKVIEALFFDQATRKFQFKKKDQIRESQAIVSFGKKFEGIRYRLRMNLSDQQADSLVHFLKSQLDGGYNILSLKKKQEKFLSKDQSWHCATLAWEAYFLATGINIDANDGMVIYPSDIIACQCFDLPDGRIRF